MVDCWGSCPDTRPSFHDISTKLENILENSEEYLEMNPNHVVKEMSEIVSNDAYDQHPNGFGETDPLLKNR